MSLFEKIDDVEKDFTTFPKSFKNYTWFKPILAFVVAFIVFIILQYLPNILLLAHVDIDFVTWGGVLSSYMIIIYIPSIYVAARIVRDRPFSSYLSSRGGWSWDIFIKLFAIALLVTLIFTAYDFVFTGSSFNTNVPIYIIILTVIIAPLQCFAEELVFRGFLMQTVGSWIGVPIVAVIIQAIIFAVLHSYNTMAILSIICTAIIFGLIAWYSKGLEITTAMHSANNIISAITISAATTITLWDSAEMIIQMLVIVALILILTKKFNFFKLEGDA